MSFKVLAIPPFHRQSKRLAKKYPSFKEDMKALVASLRSNPAQGVSIGKHCYKVRLPLTSKGKGKSGGARVITCVHIHRDTVYLLSVYDKADTATIHDSELSDRLKMLPIAT